METASPEVSIDNPAPPGRVPLQERVADLTMLDWTSLLVALVFTAALLMRVADLNTVPGLNGDEAWYGVQIQHFLASVPISWRAPTGRFSSNIFMIPLLAPVQAITGPAIWVLRLPAVAAGVLTVLIALYGLRRTWGRNTAVATALILACLPINVAYSRFGWDPSLLGPFMVAALVFSGRARWPA